MYKLAILYVFFFVIISMPVIVGCNKKYRSIKRGNHETVSVLAVFKSASSGRAEVGIIKRVYVLDTISLKDIGRSQFELKGGPDSFYIINYNVPQTDSLGKEIRDSAGHIRMKVIEIPTDKKWVRSGFENLDSAAKELNELK